MLQPAATASELKRPTGSGRSGCFPQSARAAGASLPARDRELTVHHKDHNHDNNPPDGSNWELLCVYCHDYEHTKYMDEELYPAERASERGEPPATYKPFADLADLLKSKK